MIKRIKRQFLLIIILYFPEQVFFYMIKIIKTTSFVNTFLKLSRTSILLNDIKDEKDKFCK
jgi:hypothetical protein